MTLSAQQVQQFKIDGYLVLPAHLALDQCDELIGLTKKHLEERIEPFELEATLSYPGAPSNISETGGDTVRRLLQAFHRDERLASIAQSAEIIEPVKQILQTQNLMLTPNHHNCVMTKQPEFSSETLWHRDTRYWHFSDKYLVNVWCALGNEREENGAMKILPGSHRWDVQDDALDSAQFLKVEHPFNLQRLSTQRLVELNKGDVLLFSAHCFHAAGKNLTNKTKYSLVFTYHSDKTAPIKGSRSYQQPSISVS